MKVKSAWRLIKTFRGADSERVDLWLSVPASPRSFGMADAWRVVECYRRDGKWYHIANSVEAELYSPYITHWMPIPKEPRT